MRTHPATGSGAFVALTAAVTFCGLAAPVSADSQPTATAQAAPTKRPEFLFAINSQWGTITHVGKDTGKKRMTLTLRGVNSHGTKFSDRPFREAYFIPTRRLVSSWATWFHDSDPNAVLTFTYPESRRDGMPHSIVVRLTRPRYNSEKLTLAFTARHLHRASSGPHAVSPRRPPAEFTRGSLFIDTVTYGSIIGGCAIQEATMCRNMDLPDSNIGQVWLNRSDFTRSDLSRSNLRYTTFSNSLMVSTNLSGVQAYGAHFDHANLQRASLVGAYLQNAWFNNADLQAADLSNANLQGAVMTSADFGNALLAGADLRGANLADAIFDSARAIDQAQTDDGTVCPNGSRGPCSGDQWRPQGP